jgi:hypothetical protein
MDYIYLYQVSRLIRMESSSSGLSESLPLLGIRDTLEVRFLGLTIFSPLMMVLPEMQIGIPSS